VKAFYHLGVVFNGKRLALYMLGILSVANIKIRGQLIGDDLFRLFARCFYRPVIEYLGISGCPASGYASSQ
jgi:hypothetical protein